MARTVWHLTTAEGYTSTVVQALKSGDGFNRSRIADHDERTQQMKKCLVVSFIALCVFGACTAQAKEIPLALQSVEDMPALPRVLILGDSISIGYTLHLRETLKNEANVHRAPTNCGPTTKGLEHIERWLGDGKWDVIHFNWGLHDLKYLDESGKVVGPAQGHHQVSQADYEKNLDTLTKRMKKTGARLIWCSTTPVPEGGVGRLAKDAPIYNAIALRVMKKHDIPMHDLYSFVLDNELPHSKPDNVHFLDKENKQLAESAAKAIRKALKKE
jgi:hypothetical protein